MICDKNISVQKIRLYCNPIIYFKKN